MLFFFDIKTAPQEISSPMLSVMFWGMQWIEPGLHAQRWELKLLTVFTTWSHMWAQGVGAQAPFILASVFCVIKRQDTSPSISGK